MLCQIMALMAGESRALVAQEVSLYPSDMGTLTILVAFSSFIDYIEMTS